MTKYSLDAGIALFNTVFTLASVRRRPAAAAEIIAEEEPVVIEPILQKPEPPPRELTEKQKAAQEKHAAEIATALAALAAVEAAMAPAIKTLENMPAEHGMAFRVSKRLEKKSGSFGHSPAHATLTYLISYQPAQQEGMTATPHERNAQRTPLIMICFKNGPKSPHITRYDQLVPFGPGSPSHYHPEFSVLSVKGAKAQICSWVQSITSVQDGNTITNRKGEYKKALAAAEQRTKPAIPINPLLTPAVMPAPM